MVQDACACLEGDAGRWFPRLPRLRNIRGRAPRTGVKCVVLWWLALVTVLPPCLAHAAHPEQLSFKVLHQQPHDTQTFTQGLAFVDGRLLESSGLYGRSFLTEYELHSGEVRHRLNLPKGIFAEGLTLFGDQIFLLTWKRQIALVFERRQFQLSKHFEYSGEGWGLTHDGKRLWMSDGTSTLTVRDPHTFETLDRIQVQLSGRPLERLNELEYAFDLIWANVWQDDRIVAISPATGEVRGVVDLASLVKLNSSVTGDSVLNGIAFDPDSKTFWITGKYWPRLYQLQISPPPTTLQSPPEDAKKLP